MLSTTRLVNLLVLCVLFKCDFANAFNFFGLAKFSENESSSSTVQVMKNLLVKPTSDIMLTFENPMNQIISSYYTKIFPSREKYVSDLVTELQMASMQNQAPALELLKQFGVEVMPLWLTNQIYVKGANPMIVMALMSVVSLKSITEELKFPILPIFDKILGKAPNGTEWNVKKVLADQVWKEGVKGSGVVVASIDTGVRVTHKAIRKNYVGNDNYGWHDPIFFTKTPTDLVGHGTHTVGTMVGRDGMGIAPKAKWMACRGCALSNCVQHALIACGQFFLCPSNDKENDKKKAKCTNIPDIINNSWGGPGGETFYDDVINAWKVAGIRVIFANGNNGPKCETSGSPGDHEYAIAVGSTDKNDTLSQFSSRGPKTAPAGSSQSFMGMFFGSKKESTNVTLPNICAPGFEINSAGMLSDNSYKVLSGTSMASPLVAGAAALLLSVNKKLSQEDLKSIFYSTAEQKLPPSGKEKCGSVPENEFPNNMYGYGRLNVYEAYKKMKSMMNEEEQEKAKEESKQSEEDYEKEEEGQQKSVEKTDNDS